MNPKKKPRRCRALGLNSGLDLAISRFIHSLAENTLWAVSIFSKIRGDTTVPTVLLTPVAKGTNLQKM